MHTFFPSMVRLERAVARLVASGAPGAFDQGRRPVLHRQAEGSHFERPQQGWQDMWNYPLVMSKNSD